MSALARIPAPLWRPILATIAIALIALGWQAWTTASVPGKIAADALPASGRAAIAVTLAFPPEGFHVTRLQGLGRVVRVEGATVFLADVRPENVAPIARHYWVRAIARWQP